MHRSAKWTKAKDGDQAAEVFAPGATPRRCEALGVADLLVVSGNLNLDSGNGTLLTIADLNPSPTAFMNDTTIFALINYSGSWNGGLFTHGGTVLQDGGRFTVGSQEWEIDYNRTSSAGLDNFTADYLPSSSFVAITAVPEPSTLVLLAIGTGLAGWAARRRTRGGVHLTA